MKLEGNTILVTGGTQGIGRGLAEALHKRSNKVIVAGRNREKLAEVIGANEGMSSIEIDVGNPESISTAAKRLIADHPELNVLINNAGIMHVDTPATVMDDETMSSQVQVNLLGSIRMTSALIEHLKTRPDPVVIYNSSVLAFVPLAFAGVYCATKAAIHNYAISQRFMLEPAGVRVLELLPPWVRTDLLNSSEEEEAMPLDQFIAETIEQLGSDANELIVPNARALREAAGVNEGPFIEDFNRHMKQKFGM